MFGLEIFLHYFYVNSMSEYRLWKTQNFKSYQICIVGYFTLNFMYMKFLIIWKFFRLSVNNFFFDY